MFHARKITTSANTSKASATETKIKAWGGVITKIAVRFPPGPQLLLHCAISVGGHQIFPVNESDDVVGDDESVETQEHYKLSHGWNMIKIKTWNDDTQHNHDCVIRITVLPEHIASPYHALRSVAQSLKFILRGMGLPVR